MLISKDCYWVESIDFPHDVLIFFRNFVPLHFHITCRILSLSLSHTHTHTQTQGHISRIFIEILLKFGRIYDIESFNPWIWYILLFILYLSTYHRMSSSLTKMMWISPYLFLFISSLAVCTWATLLFFLFLKGVKLLSVPTPLCMLFFLPGKFFPTSFVLGYLLSHICSSYLHINIVSLRKSSRTPDINGISPDILF